MAKALQYAQVDELLGERNSQRSIARVTGISRVTIASRIKKSASGFAGAPALAPQKGPEKGVGSAGAG
ncbi:hypothetical protein [Hymenobacter sp. IS2118]|uniref:hypothetical protein n=1 Tax=Hymenobacter sp. IS2118 TaxID=1505605 RepID=UPI000AD1105A|nr:hypothetical protein [Hymenobacter sp. IS2118]